MIINCEKLREYCDTGLQNDLLLEGFREELLEALQDNINYLPLDDMCVFGGMASHTGAEVSHVVINRDDNGCWHGMFDVEFTEESRTGCDDINIPRHIEGRVEFKIDVVNSSIEFEPHEYREWDPEEI